MASLRIPKKYHGGLAKFFLLPEESFQELISSLRSAPFAFDIRETLRKSLLAVEAITPNDAQTITDALLSLYLVRANSDNSTSEFADEFAEAIEASGSEDLQPLSEVSANIKTRLSQLLDADSLVLASKANSVMFEHDNIFTKARVLTDIRPVFGANTEVTQAAMIIHNLRIHYHRGEDHKDFFVAMDTQDVQKLINTLERAKKKAESLKSVLAAANIPYIEPE